MMMMMAVVANQCPRGPDDHSRKVSPQLGDDDAALASLSPLADEDNDDDDYR